MDKVERYRDAVISLLNEYYERFRPSDDEIETFLVIDRDHDQYQLLSDGWVEHKRYYGCILHLTIRNGKVWLSHNGTEHDIPGQLVELGVPKEDIVIGFHAPYKRKFTEYATG